MAKRVLDVGQCSVDHLAIRHYLDEQFGADVVQAHGRADALNKLREAEFALVLVNRKLDADYSDGVDVIRAIKAEPDLAETPIMLVTNYPEHQNIAIEAGAAPGFGKLEYGRPETREKLARFLEE